MASADFSPTREVPTPQVPTPRNADAAKTLRVQLERLATRRNARSLRHELSLCIAIGATICAPLLLLHRLLVIDLPLWIPAAVLILSFAIGIVRGVRKRVGVFEAALDADRVLGLDERLSSALAFAQPEEWRRAQSRSPHSHRVLQTSVSSSTRKSKAFRSRKLAPRRVLATTAGYISPPASTTLVPALLNDAAARVRVLDPKTVYPHRFDRATKFFIVAVAALATFALMPDLPVFRTLAQRQFAATLKKQGVELDEIAKPILKQPQIAEDSPTKKLAGKLEALARKMQRGRMGKEEALLEIGQLRRDLEKATKPGDNNSQPESSDVQRLREALQSQQMQSAEGQQMQRDLQNNDVKKAADQLNKLADKMDKGQMTPDEKKQAAQDLKKAADALRKNGQPDAAKKLEDAAKSLEKQAQRDQKNSNGPQQQGKNGAQKQNGQNGKQQQGQNEQKSQNGQQQKSQQNGQKQGGSKERTKRFTAESKADKSKSQQNQNGQSQQSQNGQQNRAARRSAKSAKRTARPKSARFAARSTKWRLAGAARYGEPNAPGRRAKRKRRKQPEFAENAR